MKRFYINTDGVDIRAKSLGIACFGTAERGLNVSVRHNQDPKLNEAITRGELVLPEEAQ